MVANWFILGFSRWPISKNEGKVPTEWFYQLHHRCIWRAPFYTFYWYTFSTPSCIPFLTFWCLLSSFKLIRLHSLVATCNTSTPYSMRSRYENIAIPGRLCRFSSFPPLSASRLLNTILDLIQPNRRCLTCRDTWSGHLTQTAPEDDHVFGHLWDQCRDESLMHKYFSQPEGPSTLPDKYIFLVRHIRSKN